MTINTSVGNKPADVFKTFPEFSKLTLADRAKYEALIRDLPPLSGYSFHNLMTWWNTLDTCAVATLNGNLVLSYWMPGDNKNSGLSVIGTRKIDETVCALFDHLRAKGEKVRLVHIAEHTITNLKFPELYDCVPERAADEYVLAVSKFYPLDHMNRIKRFRAKRFMARYPEESVQVKSLDLGIPDNRQLLFNAAKEWHTGLLGNFLKLMDDAMVVTINEHETLNSQNVCLYVDGRLQAYLLYHPTSDRRYITLANAIFSNELPYMFDYAMYAFAQWFADKGVSFVNIDCDLGIPAFRMLKLALGPDHYFRSYTIKPAN